MFLPKPPQKPKENPFAVQKSRRFIFASAGVAFLTTLIASYFTLEKTRERRRRPSAVQQQQRNGKRVIIIGAGAAGCALAASLTKASPSLHVTVIEREKKHVFHAMVPLAHVGHRSYDINTTGGVDFLRSPATWNVTRDACLVRGDVVRVDPARNEVVVCEDSETFTAGVEVESGSHSLPSSTLLRPLSAASLWRTWRLGGRSDGGVAANQTLRTLSYDVLVIACGAERTLGPLERFLSVSQVDRYHIAVNPGITRDCLAHLYSGNVLHVKVPPASFVKDGIMRYPSRQHDGTFIGTVNTIWRYLFYYKKFSLCSYIAVTADRQPSDAFPSVLNERISSFWRSRGVDFVTCSYLLNVDPVRHEATFYNYLTEEKRVVPYQLLVLDLPLVAPAFIQKSGLSSEVNECEGFVNVCHDTLQHRVYKNIFAFGDCAALPTVKSYGAAFAQVPVVSHNVRVLLGEIEGRGEEQPRATDPQPGFARYNGYSSFHLVMTTWRAMWPELMYGKETRKRNDCCSYVIDSAPLETVNNHIWNNLAWADLRGFFNAAFYQLFMYEVMFYFLFTRALWYPPSWFTVPTFSEENGNCVS